MFVLVKRINLYYEKDMKRFYSDANLEKIKEYLFD